MKKTKLPRTRKSQRTRKSPRARKSPKRKTSFDPLMNEVKNNPLAMKKLQEIKRRDPARYEENKHKAACVLKCRPKKNGNIQKVIKCMSNCVKN